MMYEELAKYYDALVQDDDATAAWVTLITDHIQDKELMELACGSGEITIALAKLGYHIDASDLSLQMIEEAKKKEDADLINFYQMDMNDFHNEKKYDGVLCLCDSINYLLEDEDIQNLFKNVYHALNENGVFIFDMHTLDRLDEFEEEFLEDGIANHHEYTWSILSLEDRIYHNFIFYNEDSYTQEQHVQRVYHPDVVNEWLEPYFDVTIVTDFTLEGIQSGEKLFYICRRK